MNSKSIKWYCLMLLMLGIFGNIYSQTYSCVYTQTYSDSIRTVDPKTKKNFGIPFTNSCEISIIRTGNYGLSFFSNSQNSIERMDGLNSFTSRNKFTLYDYYSHTLWYSFDSSFSSVEYKVVGEGETISSKLIRYDLEPGVYVVVDKDLPYEVCPEIFVFGLKYGVRKFVANNTVVELKSYQISQSIPTELAAIKDIFSKVSPSSVERVRPAYYAFDGPTRKDLKE